jgi:hypothetical protein
MGRNTAIIAAAGLACLAIAIPVSGAFADGDGNGNGNNTSGTPSAQGYGPGPYGQQGQQQAPNREGAPDGNCPKDQQGRPPSNGDQGNNNDSSGPALPGDTVAS